MPIRLILALGLCVLGAGCGPNGVASAGADRAATEALGAGGSAPHCPAFSETDAPLPRVSPAELTLDYWFATLGKQVDLDEVLLDEHGIERLNASSAVPREDYHPQRDLTAPLDPGRLAREVRERRDWAREKLSAREYVDQSGAPLPPAALSILQHDVAYDAVAPELRVALADAVIHCAPIPESFYPVTLDRRLDRNACSVLRAQDVVRVIAEWPNGMKLVEASYSYGWLPPAAPLSPVLPAKLASAFVHGPALEVVAALTVGEGNQAVTLPAGRRLPAADARARRAHVATAGGFTETTSEQAAALRPTRRALTRRALLEEAWRYVGTPYGLGDTAGGRDCSRLVLDVFESFDVDLPRHSSWQSRAGSFWIDTERVPEADRLLLIDAAAKKGVVLLHFPGHIMFYLGRNADGQPRVLHALGEYPESCPQGGPETLVRVKNISVSDLELGRGTSRKALIERISRITVIGKPPGVELAGVAQMRPAAPAEPPSGARCRDSEEAALYALPEEPNAAQPLRIVSALERDPGPAELRVFGPDGGLAPASIVRLGGPPYGQVATIERPRRGRYRAVLADGDDVLACQTIAVRAQRPAPPQPDAGPIWRPRYSWNAANENLYALFVERLFDHELAEDRVWSNLHTLLRDRDRNLLYDYRGLDEDARLELVPDCADLPYALRAYFAWKMRLPFGYRRCTRGRAGKPPSCSEPGADALMSRLELPGKGGRMLPRDDVEAFELFIQTQLATGVHSSSGRTLPEDELTDFYPVALTREALQPGTVFADPYGHFLVLAKWIPQGVDGYGILVGADAQPDGTIGQRRFWRGTFLFDPGTESGGAGFKAFRPRTFVDEPVSVQLELDARAAANAEKYAEQNPELLPEAPVGGAAGASAFERSALAVPVPPGGATAGGAADRRAVTIQRAGRLEELDNGELRRTTRFRALSLEQYQRSADDFYATVEALINPRPLDPRTMQRALVDALMEAVTRRVISVTNGEKWAAEHPGAVVEMPEGDAIFLAAGPWEDFSTPSRDLRLLIAIDTVVGFVSGVRQRPERYGLDPAAASARAGELEAELGAELARHGFAYVRSDGTEQRLSLADVVARAKDLEMAYNPNDCVEVRWGAPAGSAEAASCRRRAPEAQQREMERVRGWFSTRKRPPQ